MKLRKIQKLIIIFDPSVLRQYFRFFSELESYLFCDNVFFFFCPCTLEIKSWDFSYKMLTFHFFNGNFRFISLFAWNNTIINEFRYHKQTIFKLERYEIWHVKLSRCHSDSSDTQNSFFFSLNRFRMLCNRPIRVRQWFPIRVPWTSI